MAAPLVAAPLLGKALAFAKGLTGLGAAKAGLTTGSFMKGAAARRMAGDAVSKLASSAKGLSKGVNMADDAGLLDKVRRGVTPAGFAKNLGIPMSKSDIAMTVAPDLLFGGIAAATTEGDIIDKAIAGAGSAVGGIAGGLGTRGLLGPKSGLGILGSEMVGGIVGDQVGYGAANALIAAKHGGMTPAEKRMSEQDGVYRQQIIDQFLAENGLG